MAYSQNAYYDVANDRQYGAVAESPAAVRATFVKRTYAHLTGAILAFAGLEMLLFQTGVAEQAMTNLFTSRGSYLVLMLVFVGGGFLASAMANSARSKAAQYVGLGLYVLLQAVIFLPLLYIVESKFQGQNLPAQAGIITAAVFAGLTAGVFISGKDFSFLGPILMVLSFAAIGVILASMFIGFSLGIVFPAAMVVLAAGYIIYDTSNIMHHYHPEQYVAASLALFASVALMFFYVLRLLMSLRGND